MLEHGLAPVKMVALPFRRGEAPQSAQAHTDGKGHAQHTLSKRNTRIGASRLFGVHNPRTNCDSDCVRADVTPWSLTGTGTRGSAALKVKPGLFSAWLASHVFSSSCPSCGSAYAPSSTVQNRTPVCSGSASFWKSSTTDPVPASSHNALTRRTGTLLKRPND